MRTITLGRTGVKVPAISLGSWGYSGLQKSQDNHSVGWDNHTEAAGRQSLIDAWRAGITHWDTADAYGDGLAEQQIGRVWGEVPRNEIFLASKVGWVKGPYEHYYHPDLIRSHMEESLRNLKTDVIDLYYLHHCFFGTKGMYFDGALELFHRFRDEGKIRFIGLSDWNLKSIMHFVDKTSPDVIQPYRCVSDDAWVSSGLKAWVDKHNPGVAFFSPLKHGLLLGKYDAPVTFPDGDFRSGVKEFGKKDVIDKMNANRRKIEARFEGHSEPMLHALLGALLEDAPTACVLMGLRKPDHVKAAAMAGAALSAEDAAWVRGLYV